MQNVHAQEKRREEIKALRKSLEFKARRVPRSLSAPFRADLAKARPATAPRCFTFAAERRLVERGLSPAPVAGDTEMSVGRSAQLPRQAAVDAIAACRAGG
jgi:hypothetical protein